MGGEEHGAQEHRLTDVDGVVVPVTAGHVLVDIGIDARHLVERGGSVAIQRRQTR